MVFWLPTIKHAHSSPHFSKATTLCLNPRSHIPLLSVHSVPYFKLLVTTWLLPILNVYLDKYMQTYTHDNCSLRDPTWSLRSPQNQGQSCSQIRLTHPFQHTVGDPISVNGIGEHPKKGVVPWLQSGTQKEYSDVTCTPERITVKNMLSRTTG